MSTAEIVASAIAGASFVASVSSAIAAYYSYKISASALEWEKNAERRQQEHEANITSRSASKRRAMGR